MKTSHVLCVLTLAFVTGTLAASMFSGCQQSEPVTVSGDRSPATSASAPSTEAITPETSEKDPPADESPPPQTVPATPIMKPLPAATTENKAAPDAVRSIPEAVASGDCTQLGGTSHRNNTPTGSNIPTTWNIGDIDHRTGEWIRDEAKNIKWVAPLGSTTYGNPVIAKGHVYVGTNNGAGYVKRYPADVDLGCLLCFQESDGAFLWQHSSEKLPSGSKHDWELQGICSTPLVEGDRLWFVSNRGHVVCLDTEGFHDGEDDGPVTKERGRLFNILRNNDPDKDLAGPAIAALDGSQVSDELRQRFQAAGFELPSEVKITVEDAGAKWSLTAQVGEVERPFFAEADDLKLSVFGIVMPSEKTEADTVWSFDMMNELGARQHNMASCSVTALGDVLFVSTSNGVDETHEEIPAPRAPSFVALNKHSGEVYWTDASPGENILHGQWSSPAAGVLGDVPQVLFAGGDGWVYSFRADQGKDGKPELLWKFDANPKETEWVLGGRGDRNNIIATPVIDDGLVYVAVGQDPEHGEGVGHLWCIDPTKRGDVSPQLAFSIDGDKRVPLPPRRERAVDTEKGEVAEDNPNSAAVWHYTAADRNQDGIVDFEEEMHRSLGTVAVKNDLLFVADFSGLFHCVHAKTGQFQWNHDMLAQAWGSPLIVDDHVYIGDEDGDIAVFNLSGDPEIAMKRIDDELVPINADETGEVNNMGNSVYSSPVVANNVLFIANKEHLFAIETK